jgi:hypothetical protein
MDFNKQSKTIKKNDSSYKNQLSLLAIISTEIFTYNLEYHKTKFQLGNHKLYDNIYIS